MSKITILTIGKLKNKSIKNLQEDYLKRLSHYTSCQLIELRDSKHRESHKKNEEESQNLINKISAGDYVILLDEKGTPLSSVQLSQKVQEFDNQGVRHLVLIIGGPYGVSEALKKRVHLILSLSTLTLPHELARVLLLEQLYRAYTILRGEKYHH